ncbi:methyltransferase [Desulfosarcina ovata subsp. sediminis]|uniref:Methyltransferase n=1 Tax=Desulfosarcina ovata subsp. sediminis TaxID=885957 RepID=A0A5K7ZY33_9BACT|nr:16S rRNA (guanine(966)-N(2))-methyltransferase RsmD [Desulfosarcina ovata]BBO85158.1 methyltransferase [Desulfosarcina ovata subsp. sediminis]
MRVISGRFRGRRLVAPAGMGTRPTTDRIRESLFNILGPGLHSKQVLDLFAGTGALGIEALSRGAAAAVFVDQAKAALATIRRNLRQLQLEGVTRVLQWDIRKNLNCLKHERHRFNLVFMDPPYETQAVVPALTALLQCGAMADDARVIVEHSRRESLDPIPAGLILSDQRQFGKTLVSFLNTVL